MPEPKHNKGRSAQDYRTPRPFLTAVQGYLGIGDFDCDLAASRENAVCPVYYTEESSAFDHSWKRGSGWNWLNPPFAHIERWVRKAKEERYERQAQTCVLLPAGVSTEWFARHVHNHAEVVFVRPRLTFVGLMLLLYYGGSGYSTWRWDA